MSGTVFSFRVCCLLWSAARPDGDFQSQAFDDSLRPSGISKRRTSIDAASQRGDLGVRLGLVDVLPPLTWAGNRPRTQHTLTEVVPLVTMPQTAPYRHALASFARRVSVRHRVTPMRKRQTIRADCEHHVVKTGKATRSVDWMTSASSASWMSL